MTAEIVEFRRPQRKPFVVAATQQTTSAQLHWLEQAVAYSAAADEAGHAVGFKIAADAIDGIYRDHCQNRYIARLADITRKKWVACRRV